MNTDKILYIGTNIEHVDTYNDYRKSDQIQPNVPEVLQTEQAKMMWNRLREAGFVNDLLLPAEGRHWAEMSIIAFEMGCALNLDSPFRPFEILWQHPGLSKNYNTAYNTNKAAGDWALSIRELLTDNQ